MEEETGEETGEEIVKGGDVLVGLAATHNPGDRYARWVDGQWVEFESKDKVGGAREEGGSPLSPDDIVDFEIPNPSPIWESEETTAQTLARDIARIKAQYKAQPRLKVTVETFASAESESTALAVIVPLLQTLLERIQEDREDREDREDPSHPFDSTS